MKKPNNSSRGLIDELENSTEMCCKEGKLVIEDGS
jgi:hypothetical protein